MAAEAVKVIVRCRPINKRENSMKCKTIVSMQNCEVKLTNPNDLNCPPKQFTFDSTYDTNSNTENLYNDICYPLVESVLEGYNATIFAYGQTGCGKSFTMEGADSPQMTTTNVMVPESLSDISQIKVIELNNNQSLQKGPNRGITHRSLEHIFEAIAVTSDIKFLVLVNYLEIYNEQIR